MWWWTMGVVAWAQASTVAADDPFGGASETRKFGLPTQDATFPTGFRVVLAPDDSAPVVGVTMVIEAGGAQNPPDQAGLAHLVEHLWFLSRQNGRPPTFQYLQSLGCWFNASTSLDEVRYETACPSHLLARLLQLQGEMLVDPLKEVTPEAFALEREVVHAERREGEHTGVPSVWTGILPVVHPGDHPYSRPNIGTAESLDALTLAHAQAFTDAHYRASEATLVLTGDFRIDDALRMIFRAFPREAFVGEGRTTLMKRFALPGVEHPDPDRDEDWVLWLEDPDHPGSPLPPRSPVPRWDQRGLALLPGDGTIHVVEGDVEERILALVWTLEPVDPFVTGVLPSMLDNVVEAAAFPGGRDEGGCTVASFRRDTLLACFFEVGSKGPEPTFDKVLRSVKRLKAPTQSSFSRAMGIVRRRLGMLSSLERIAGVGTGRNAVLAEHVHLGHSADYLRATDELYKRSTLEDAAEWLAARLDPKAAHRFDLRPGEVSTLRDAGRTKASLTGAQVDLADEATPERARTFDASLGEGRVQHDRFANGLRVVAVDQGRMPFVDLLLVAPAPALPAGLDELVLAAFQHDAEHEGNVLLSDLGLSLGPDTWVLRARAMSSELDKGMKALRQLVDTQKVNGAVAADRLGRIRRIRRSLAREAERWPWVDAEARALEPAWRGALLLQGDEARADLAAAKAKDLDALLAATFRPSRSVLVVAGSVEAWDGVESARGAFSDWKGRPAAPPTYALPPAAPLATQGLLLDEEEATQAIVSLTCVATDAGEAARHEEAVADLLSRALYLTLREELGWAYSPFAVGDHQRDRARYTLLATVPLDRLEPTVAHLRSLLRRAEQEGFDERTLEDLRTRQVLQTPLRRQTRWSVAHSLAEALLEGHSVEDWRQVVPLVSDLGTDEVKQALKGCAEHELVVVRGPASRIPDTVREALGGTWEVVEPNEDAKENR